LAGRIRIAQRPPLQHSAHHSANQENITGSPTAGLHADDQIFLRPAIVEGVLLQFGDLITLRGGKIQDHGPVYPQSD
jgi:D-serine deaminase-like pyridoxal phosphate-dependent protein